MVIRNRRTGLVYEAKVNGCEGGVLELELVGNAIPHVSPFRPNDRLTNDLVVQSFNEERYEVRACRG